VNHPMANNQTKPNQTQSRPRARAGGIFRGGMVEVQEVDIDQEELPPLESRRAREFAFVREHLSTEHEGFAVSSLIALQMAGKKPTKQQVLDRLGAQGRRSDQLREKGWM
jgi:hypothetical protein